MTIHGACDAILSATRVIAFTGAGVSVPSGIPDFRSSEGIWARYPPEEYATIQAFHADPERWWAFFRELSAAMEGTGPNPAHEALAELEALGCLQAVITQNVDQLHQRAGNSQVIELHGSPARLACLSCQSFTPGPAPSAGPAPRCEACGEVLKPDVVLFGETLPLKALAEAEALASSAEVCLTVGTSGVVYPAAGIPELTQRGGGVICQFNREPTGLTHTGRVRWFVEGPAEETLPRLVALIQAKQADPAG